MNSFKSLLFFSIPCVVILFLFPFFCPTAALAIPTPTPQPCEPSTGCLSFDGIDDYISVSDSPELDLTDAITIEGWFRPSYISDKRLMGKHRPFLGYGFGMYPDYFYFGFGDDGSAPDPNVYSDTIPAPGEWYHLAGAFDGSALKMYVNGIFEASTDFTGSIGIASNVFAIGNYGWAGSGMPEGRYFQGLIDDVSIYSVALTASQISEIYNDKSHPLTGLVAHWGFNDGFGDTLSDSIGSHNGTVLGASWTGEHRPNDPCATPTPASSQCPEDMVAYWRADGDAADYVADHNGTLMGGATFAAGHCEQAFSLDGWAVPASMRLI